MVRRIGGGRNAGNQEPASNAVFIEDLKGTLEMSLKDTNGNMIFQVTNMLSKLTWCRAGQQPPWLYDSKTFFTTSITNEYILDVSIVPDQILKNNFGHILFRSGGWGG
jgi:hypothetical protein